MHVRSSLHNPAPTILAALAGLPRGKDQPVSVLAERDRIAIEALKSGYSANAVGNAAGLKPRTVERIANGRRSERDGDAGTQTPSLARTAGGVSSLGKVTFDQAGPTAIAVMNARDGTCRWPIDVDGGLQYCGERVAYSRSGKLVLRSFCGTHSDRAYAGRRVMVAEAV